MAEMFLFFSFIIGITAAISLLGLYLARQEDHASQLSSRNSEFDSNRKKTA